MTEYVRRKEGHPLASAPEFSSHVGPFSSSCFTTPQTILIPFHRQRYRGAEKKEVNWPNCGAWAAGTRPRDSSLQLPPNLFGILGSELKALAAGNAAGIPPLLWPRPSYLSHFEGRLLSRWLPCPHICIWSLSSDLLELKALSPIKRIPGPGSQAGESGRERAPGRKPWFPAHKHGTCSAQALLEGSD